MGDMTDEDKMMQQLMGFQGFDTTKVFVSEIFNFSNNNSGAYWFTTVRLMILQV